MEKIILAVFLFSLFFSCNSDNQNNNSKTQTMDNSVEKSKLTEAYQTEIDSFVMQLRESATCKSFVVGGKMGGSADICLKDTNSRNYIFNFSSFHKENVPTMSLAFREMELVFVCEIIPDFRGEDGMMKYYCIAYYLKDGKILGAKKCKRDGLWDKWYDCEDYTDFIKEEKEKLFAKQAENLKRGYEKFPELQKAIEEYIKLKEANQ